MTDEHAVLQRLVETFYFDVWNRGDEEAARRILSSDLEFRGSTGPTKRGVDQFLGYDRRQHHHPGRLPVPCMP